MDALKTYNKLKNLPFGKSIFTYGVCKQAPYFSTIRPKVVEYQNGLTVVEMKERRSIHNHIKTVHAIAMCNLCELAMGLATMASIPKNLQWIPKGMQVDYKKIAKGTLRAIVKIKESDFSIGDVAIPVDVFNEKDENVMSAVITLYIKNK